VNGTAPSINARGPWKSLGFAAVYLVVLIAALMGVGAVHQLLAPGSTASGAGTSPVTWIFTVAGVLLAHVVMLRFVDRRPWSDVALGRSSASWVRVLTGIAVGALAVGIPCAVLLASHWLTIAPGVGGNVGAVTLRMLAFLVPAALAEELMVRGYLLTALADGFGRVTAVIATSVFFGALHFANPGATPWSLVMVTLAGIWLGVVRLTTDSLYAAWAAHLAWNFVLGGVLHAAVSGQDMTIVAWRTLDSGPDWATGGAWGPEGGAAAAAGLLFATLLLLARPLVRGDGNRMFARRSRGELTA
jgi:membrane protease YdiL (CAAX protease family)